MNELLVTLSGPPGSGKTTAGRDAAARIGLEFFSAGELFRAEAERRGLDLAAFSALAERDDAIDRALDAEMLRLARPGRFLEGRITGALCRRAHLPALYLVVTARETVRVQRLAERDGRSVEETAALTRAREESERRRYHRIYGIDLARETPDLIIDSSELSVSSVVDTLVQYVSGRQAHDRP